MRKFVFDRNKILEVKNIDAGVTSASETDYGYAIFTSGDGTERKRFELHRLKFLNKNAVEKTIKVPLTQTEANIINNRSFLSESTS